MIYALRRSAEAGGGIDPASSGTLVAPDGRAATWSARTCRSRSSTAGGARPPASTYPSRWRLRVPSAALDVEVRPVLEDQELDVGFRYWEGAVDVHGSSSGAPVGGRGYVELTGYGPEAARDRRRPSEIPSGPMTRKSMGTPDDPRSPIEPAEPADALRSRRSRSAIHYRS